MQYHPPIPPPPIPCTHTCTMCIVHHVNCHPICYSGCTCGLECLSDSKYTDWKRISTELALMSPPPPSTTKSVKGLQYIVQPTPPHPHTYTVTQLIVFCILISTHLVARTKMLVRVFIRCSIPPPQHTHRNTHTHLTLLYKHPCVGQNNNMGGSNCQTIGKH